MTGTEFVRQVMSRLEVTTAAGLAEKMRWKRGMERTVSRWLAGESEPNFGYTIDMARRAGLLSLGETAVTDSTPRPDLQVLLEEVATTDVELLANQREGLIAQQQILDELRALRAVLELPAAASRTGPKQTRRRAQ